MKSVGVLKSECGDQAELVPELVHVVKQVLGLSRMSGHTNAQLEQPSVS